MYEIDVGVHLYVPPEVEASFEAERLSEVVCVSGGSAAQARGQRLVVRAESFLAGCATPAQSLRWILTPQYLSRRVFLHHDETLLSRSGNPVSWFRTTMFDVAGLPGNEQGEPVFKMSYNSRTEFNVCYDVRGQARVRMALHPYSDSGQAWGPWQPLDSDSTYHLNEAAGGPEEECRVQRGGQPAQCLRNKHEVSITGGHVTLFCLFDPAPTGLERHRPGEYSDYEPLSQVIASPVYEAHQREILRFDRMVDTLSMAQITGSLEALRRTPEWELYEEGRRAQAAIEARLATSLSAQGHGRQRVIEPWVRAVGD